MTIKPFVTDTTTSADLQKLKFEISDLRYEIKALEQKFSLQIKDSELLQQNKIYKIWYVIYLIIGVGVLALELGLIAYILA